MKLEGRKLIADEGKVLDYAEPKYALDDEGTPVQIHLYVKFLTMGRMDKVENYIEVDDSILKEG